jgi:hypothetical protein
MQKIKVITYQQEFLTISKYLKQLIAFVYAKSINNQNVLLAYYNYQLVVEFNTKNCKNIKKIIN